jgi:hypothetical protein
MMGIRDEKHMWPLYDFKFNKRSLEGITIIWLFKKEFIYLYYYKSFKNKQKLWQQNQETKDVTFAKLVI